MHVQQLMNFLGTWAGIISWENFVFKEVGENFPGRNLGALAMQRVYEAV